MMYWAMLKENNYINIQSATKRKQLCYKRKYRMECPSKKQIQSVVTKRYNKILKYITNY